MSMNYSRSDRTWAMFCHLSAFAGLIFPLGHILAPLILWLMKRESSPYIAEQGKEALNFQISMSIYIALAFLFNIVLVGFGIRMPSMSMSLMGNMQLLSIPVMAAVMLFGFGMVIYAAIKVNRGAPFRYPLTLRFVK